MQTVLSIHYLPCIVWFRNLLQHENVVLDVHEHFLKQTYRNRCHILGANGVLALTVPVKKRDHKQSMQKTCIEYEMKWQHQHWQSIVSAYNSSPFFLYYRDGFEALYQTTFESLVDLNLAMITHCLKLLKVEKKWSLSEAYIAVEGKDLRESIHPKRPEEAVLKPYWQVFSEKMPFQADLSIIDLLFNKGPESLRYILEEK